MDVSDRLSEALAGRLALQMSISSLEVIEEWMDMPLTRWLDSIPLPMEMPDASSPAVLVMLGSDARRVRWSAGGPPEGIIPKMVDYLRRAGALPGDFNRIDRAGQALEPHGVGSWIEVRPGAVETGWYFADRLPVARLRELLGEGAWMEEAGAMCAEVLRGIGADPVTEVTFEVEGPDPAARLAAAAATASRLGCSLDVAAAGALGAELSLVVRARGGAVEAVRLAGARPGGQAAASLCGALGLELAASIDSVARAIAAGEPTRVAVEGGAGGAAVLVSYLAGSAGAAHVN